MALQRAPLGQRGSYLATGLNVLQCLGWSVFEITVIAIAASALSDRLFGVHLVWMWKLVFGALGLVLALLGPVGFVRRFVRKVGIWASPHRSSTSACGSSATAMSAASGTRAGAAARSGSASTS